MNEPDKDPVLDEDAVEDKTSANDDPQPATEGDQPEGTTTDEEVKTERRKLSRTERMDRRYGEMLRRQEEELKFLRSMVQATTPGTQPAKPKLADYTSVEDYVEAREAYLKKELLAEVSKTVARPDDGTRAYAQKVQQFKKELTDWDEVMEDAADEPTAQETVAFCLESDIGPKIAYYLAKHPSEHERINSMSPTRRTAELGKLEDRLLKPEPKVATKAPGKLTTVSGTGTTAKKDLSTYVPTSYAEWKELDKARRAK